MASAEFKVTVTPKGGTKAGWAILYFAWNGSFDPPPVLRPIPPSAWKADGEGKFSATIRLKRGQYCLQGDVVPGESKISIDLTPRPTLAPPSEKWPLTVEVPPTRTRAVGTILFDVGEGS
ncbi:MAG: hypothetical protein M3177_08705 [Pseudomonadota bacterium]|nr:hypothetical protein [Pseudomonadota bacterium]